MEGHEEQMDHQETAPQQEVPVQPVKKNGVSRLLYIMALVLFIGGAVLGLAVFWMTADYAGWLNAVIQMGAVWVNAAVFGGVLLGISEIIRLLDRHS
ncbi:hypothetical protein [uncultured Oscillibacter sp.]|uniref:hypothetical protein n=1 Tax=uncultured Oscillibacter sp. TaxID=876091 RepID=UPI0025D3D9C6|nr:hypothetical protein [uncultured Oscillibacter sp.]